MGLAVDLVAVLGTVATVIVAIMTWRIANRQTSIAADMKTLTETATDAQQAQAAAATKQLALSEQQLNLSEHQGKIEQRLADLEEARMYANLVPSHLQWFNHKTAPELHTSTSTTLAARPGTSNSREFTSHTAMP